jgi:excisionase family DNA binding protein
MESTGAPLNRTIVDHLRQRSGYLRSTEVMALLDVTRATLCSWINSGQLKAYRLGKNNSVDPADLVSFLEARCTRG